MKQDLVDFLFWLQYPEQEQLLKDWLNAMASNAYIAQKYLEWVETQSDQSGS